MVLQKNRRYNKKENKMMSIINGNTSIFQLIGDAYTKKDKERFYYAYQLCVRAKTNMKVLHKYLINRHNFTRIDCANLLRSARIVK
jgi:hypothetical protein